MLGAGVQLSDDGFYTPAKGRKSRDQLRRAQSDATGNHQSDAPSGEGEGGVPASSNLERFLGAVTPSVTAQYLSKVDWFCNFLLIVFERNRELEMIYVSVF